MNEYIKIPNIYMREQFGNNKLLTGQFSSPELEYLADCKWILTEKVDGTNIRVIWDGYRVELKGRTDKAQIPANLYEKLTELFLGEDKEELFEQKFGNKTAILYGEGYGEKIQNGGKYGPVNFILFDVVVDGYWLNRDSVENIAKYFAINVVPLVGECNLREAVDFISTHPKSNLKDDVMEGVVARPKCQVFTKKGDPVIVKIKCRDFDQRDFTPEDFW